MSVRIREFGDKEFHEYFSEKMVAKERAIIEPEVLDDYMNSLARLQPDLMPWDQTQLEYVWHTEDGRLQHLLFPEGQPNIYLVLVCDLSNGEVLGHHMLNLNEKYGLTTPARSKDSK